MTQPGSSHQPERPLPASSDAAKPIVVCSICQATYAPAQSHAYLLQAPPIALESAFMSMCHFCFRCRRPACPACWDDVHGVCGSCGAEAHLPFRSAATPFSGVLFPPSHRSQQIPARSVSSPLVCISPGCYQNTVPSSSNVPATPSQQSTTVPSSGKKQLQPDNLKPAHEQKELRSVRHSPRSPSSVDISELETRPGRRSHHRPHRARRVFATLGALLLTLAILIAIIVGAALLWGGVNAALMRVLHVDIRAEIAYLLQLIKDLL